MLWRGLFGFLVLAAQKAQYTNGLRVVLASGTVKKSKRFRTRLLETITSPSQLAEPIN